MSTPARPLARSLVLLVVGLLVALGSLPTGVARAADPTAVDRPVAPSVHYEEWLAHADDPITFVPGDRVTVGFQPRSGDRTLIGGLPARALPAGRASGIEMAATPQGARWSPLGGPTDVSGDPAAEGPSDASPAPSADPSQVPGTFAPDESIVDPAGIVDAEGASFLVPHDGEALVPTALAGLRREVFGFLPYWEVSDASTTLDYDVLSTIAYFSVGATRAGDLIKGTSTGWTGWTSSKMTSIINAAHRAGSRVVLTVSVFAWTDSQRNTQAALLGDPSARLNLARQAAAAVRDRGADGINLDFEPIVSGYADEFATFVREVRRELDAITPGYQLTFDTTGYIGNYPLEAATAPGGADAIFIMGYDYRGSGSSPVGSIAPLAGPRYDIADTLDAYLARVPASKLILGVPYYGRAWSTDSSALNARNISGSTYGYSSAVVYGSAMDYLAANGRRYDALEQVAWTLYHTDSCTGSCWRQLYVDDVQALGAKYDLVNRRGLRGVGMWALGYDGTRPELYRLLRQKFVDDTTPPVVGIDVLPTSQSSEGFRVTWSAYDDNAIASYDVQVATNGGAWQTWLTGTSSGGGVYLGAEGGRFAFRARARDVKGNLSAWDVTSSGGTPASLAVGAFGRVTTTGLRMRAGPDTSATQLGTLSAGDTLLLTGGPATADGYTWYRVRGPLREWAPVTAVEDGFWVAASGNGSTYLVPRQPPNVTVVKAGIHGLSIGSSAAAAAAPASPPTVSPNGDGVGDTVTLAWTNAVGLDSLTLRVHRPDGSLAGTLSLSGRAAGRQAMAWDARTAAGPLPDGTYVLQLVGTAGSVTYAAPSPVPVTADTIARYSVRVDRLPVSRLAGPDRYATAAAVSAASFAPGVPVAYLAVGTDYPDALAGSVAAARAGGPVLLTSATSLPAATATELARLKPSRIVVLGGTGVVSDAVASAARAYATTKTVSRLAGPDRYATAAAVSAASFAPGVPVAYLAVGTDYPDALAGSVAAARAGGPVLLTSATSLPAATATELARLKPSRIVVLGGTGVVSDAVASAARAYATTKTVSRLAGPDRYATAAAVSAASFAPGVPVAYLAVGTDYPDALAGSVAAARAGGPVLLTSATSLPAATATELARLKPSRIVVLGGTGVVSDAVASAARSAAGGR